MKSLSIFIKILITVYSMQLLAANGYQPETGDNELNDALISLNKKIKKHQQGAFSRKIADEFQIPHEKVEELFKHYEFTAADVLMTLSITDISGQPLNNISRAYFENKKLGWKFVLEQLDIHKGTDKYNQMLKDTEAEFLGN